jgi:hypothetical protein
MLGFPRFLGERIGSDIAKLKSCGRKVLPVDQGDEFAANGPKLPFTKTSNAAVQPAEADIDALPQHY